jgi:hypothetical protein
MVWSLVANGPTARRSWPTVLAIVHGICRVCCDHVGVAVLRRGGTRAFKRRDLLVTQPEKRGVACATMRRRRETPRGIRSRPSRYRAERALRCLLDGSNGAAPYRSAVCRDVIAGLGDARSSRDDVQHRLADADAGVLAAVPAARMGTAVGRALAIDDAGTVTVAGNDVDGFTGILAVVGRPGLGNGNYRTSPASAWCHKVLSRRP